MDFAASSEAENKFSCASAAGLENMRLLLLLLVCVAHVLLAEPVADSSRRHNNKLKNAGAVTNLISHANQNLLNMRLTTGVDVGGCFERIAIGRRLADVTVSTPLSTLSECEMKCFQSQDCRAFSFGMGRHGNGTCEMQHGTASDRLARRQGRKPRRLEPTQQPEDPDYDLFERRPDCEVPSSTQQPPDREDDREPPPPPLLLQELGPLPGEQGADENETGFTCFRRLFSGRRLAEHHVRRSLPASSVFECEMACQREQQFFCEGFNFREDRRRVGRGSCELSARPQGDLGPGLLRDFHEDREYDFYERRRGGPPECAASFAASGNGESNKIPPPENFNQNRPPPGNFINRPSPGGFNRGPPPPPYSGGPGGNFNRPPPGGFNGPPAGYNKGPGNFNGPVGNYNGPPGPGNFNGPPGPIGNYNGPPGPVGNYNGPPGPVGNYNGPPGPGNYKGPPGPAGNYNGPPGPVGNFNGPVGNYNGGFNKGSGNYNGPPGGPPGPNRDWNQAGPPPPQYGPQNRPQIGPQIGPQNRPQIGPQQYPQNQQGPGGPWNGNSPNSVGFYGPTGGPGGPEGNYGGGPNGMMQQQGFRPQDDECFSRVWSGQRLHDSVIKGSSSPPNLGGCQLECLHARDFTCRAFTFRFVRGPGDSCLLTDRQMADIHPREGLTDDPEFEFYERSSFIQGCEHLNQYPSSLPWAFPEQNNQLPPLIAKPLQPPPNRAENRPIAEQECYAEYWPSARLAATAVTVATNAPSLSDCLLRCTGSEEQWHTPCRSLAYRNGVQGHNCLLSELAQRDLRPDRDFVHDGEGGPDGWRLMAWDWADPRCREPPPRPPTNRPLGLPGPYGPAGPPPPSGAGPWNQNSGSYGGGTQQGGYGLYGGSSGQQEGSGSYGGSNQGSGSYGGVNQGSGSYGGANQGSGSYGGANQGSGSYGGANQGSGSYGGANQGSGSYGGANQGSGSYGGANQGSGSYGGANQGSGSYGGVNQGSGSYGGTEENYGGNKGAYGGSQSSWGTSGGSYGGASGSGSSYGGSSTGSGVGSNLGGGSSYGGASGSYGGGNSWGAEGGSFTVNGKPCARGHTCQINPQAGFWSCPIGDGDGKEWDYCCNPSHKCGYSEGMQMPWCYVGHTKDQWRPCSERYWPYSANNKEYGREGRLLPVAFLHKDGPPGHDLKQDSFSSTNRLRSLRMLPVNLTIASDADKKNNDSSKADLIKPLILTVVHEKP